MASAHGPGTEGAGIRGCGYAIKNSGLIVEVNRQHLHVCVKEPRVKIRTSGVARAGLNGRGPYRNTVVTSDVGDNHLPESLSGPCGCFRYHELNTHKVTKRERERERALLGTTVHNGGSRAAPAARTPHPHALSCFPTHNGGVASYMAKTFPGL